MPIYEYSCQACGHRFQEMRCMEDRHLAICPQCHGRAEKFLSCFAALGSSEDRNGEGLSGCSCCSNGSCHN